jgi:hypothetical protein
LDEILPAGRQRCQQRHRDHKVKVAHLAQSFELYWEDIAHQDVDLFLGNLWREVSLPNTSTVSSLGGYILLTSFLTTPCS